MGREERGQPRRRNGRRITWREEKEMFDSGHLEVPVDEGGGGREEGQEMKGARQEVSRAHVVVAIVVTRRGAASHSEPEVHWRVGGVQLKHLWQIELLLQRGVQIWERRREAVESLWAELVEDPVDVPHRKGGVGLVRGGALDSGEIVHRSLVIIVRSKYGRGMLIESWQVIRGHHRDYIRNIPSWEMREDWTSDDDWEALLI
jgi:hypothetical protein